MQDYKIDASFISCLIRSPWTFQQLV